MKVFVIGSLNMDLTIKSPKVPDCGMTVTGNGFLATAGGKGANQAVACAKLGAKTFMAGCVGNAFATELLDSLKQSGVDTQFVEKRCDVSSGIAVILVVDGDNRIVLDRGANGKVDRALVDRALGAANKGDILILQLEIPIETVEYALRLAKEKGMTTVLNPAPAAPVSDSALSYSDYFTPNQTEAQFYTGIYPDDEGSIRTCVDCLRGKGIKNVIITLGKLGSVGYFGDKCVRVNATKVETVDTTAAGDTYIGGFAAGLCAGKTQDEAMRFASVASALAVTKRGAQSSIPTLKDVESFFKSNI